MRFLQYDVVRFQGMYVPNSKSKNLGFACWILATMCGLQLSLFSLQRVPALHRARRNETKKCQEYIMSEGFHLEYDVAG